LIDRILSKREGLAMTFLEKWRESRERKRVERERLDAERQAAAKAAWEASPEGRRAAAKAQRLQEVEELKVKLLNPPPERMAASLKIWEKDHSELTIPENKNDINTGLKSFVVDLYLVPSEQERQIITSFKLDDLILDDEPRYTPQELSSYEQASLASNAEIARINRNYAESNAQFDQWHREEMEERRRARHSTSLKDFFNFPHTRAFATNHEAHTYAVRLREELLPKVRQFIEDYRSRTNEETFTV
jgi:hypothetical protein